MAHQAVAIMYCTQQVIQGENFCDRLKKLRKFSPSKVYGILLVIVLLEYISLVSISVFQGLPYKAVQHALLFQKVFEVVERLINML